MNLKTAAKKVAAQGRFADDSLVHMNKAEIAGLASLMPGGRLPINPKTGLPEAFFFLPFLAGLAAPAAATAAAAIPATIAAGAAAPAAAAGLGALGAGMTAGMTAASTALPAAAGAAASALPAAAEIAAATTAATAPAAAASTALPAAAEMAAATAAPALSSPLTVGTSGSLAPAFGAQGASGLQGFALPASAPAAPLSSPLTVGTSGNLAPAVGAQGAASMPVAPTPSALGSEAVGAAVNPARFGLEQAAVNPLRFGGGANNPFNYGGELFQANITPTAPQVGDLAAGIGPEPFAPMQPAQGARAASGLQGYVPPETAAAMPVDPQMPMSEVPMAGRIAPDPSYFPPAPTESGGLGGLLKGGISGKGFGMNEMMMASMMLKGLGGGGKKKGKKKDLSKTKYGGGDPSFPGDDYDPGHDGEWDYFPDEQYFNTGGMVKRYAQGGLASIGPMAQPPQGAMPPQQAGGGIAQLMQPPMMQPPQAPPLPKSQIGSPYGQDAQSNPNDEEIIAQAVEAIQGKHPSPDTALIAFVQTFGEAALQDLVARVKGGSGGMTKGAGDGMSDSIPAMIDGQQPAALSSGEFVIPADVVSGLGNGSTDAGAAELEGLMDRVRTFRNGGAVQPPAINPRAMMPA